MTVFIFVVSIFSLGLEHLHKFIAASAFHDSNERHPPPRCHPSTRERILQKIRQWITEDSSTRIVWLSGSTGTGKSAIAQTAAERCKEDGLTAAFFFFRSSPERSPATRLIATIAYQIALFVPGAESFVTKAVEDDLSVFSKDLSTQIYHLVVLPLKFATRAQTSKSYFVVIIDGLDECVDEKTQSDIWMQFTLHLLPKAFRYDFSSRAGQSTKFELGLNETTFV